jgi:exportin-T
MDAQIENAVEILGNPTSDPSLKQQAFDFVNQLRSDPGAWQVCAGLFTRDPRASDLVRMACLEIVNYAVHNQGLDTPTLTYLKDNLLDYVRRTYSPDAQLSPDPASIQNKLVQTLTYLFVFLYQDGWQSFMDDFMALTGPAYENTNGVALYLRVLSSIHDEIADMLLTRHSGDAKRNTDLKDRVRAQDMHKIAQSWKDILGRYVGQSDAIVEMVMRVIGKWVGWMDISLVIDSDMLGLLLPVVGRSNDTGRQDQVRNSAIGTLTEIVGKKMKLGDKMQLIRIMNLHEIVSRLIASPPLSDLRQTPNYDTDLAEAVAKLVNTVMTDVVKALEESGSDNELRSSADGHLQDFLPLLLRFFSDEYDEVCSSVISSLTDLLAAMRKIPNRPQSYNDMLPPILNAVIIKMRYDDTASWGDEDEKTDEAEFAELRKRLQVLQKSIEAVNQDLFVDVLSNLVGNAFQTLEQQGSHMDWRDLDLALHEMELFGELALPNQGLSGKNQPSAVATERLAMMMTKMVESGECEMDMHRDRRPS